MKYQLNSGHPTGGFMIVESFGNMGPQHFSEHVFEMQNKNLCSMTVQSANGPEIRVDTNSDTGILQQLFEKLDKLFFLNGLALRLGNQCEATVCSE